jgi:riboflavin synthase
MFTGIIEEIGKVAPADVRDDGLVIAARVVLEGTAIGDSIAVNGACLTVTKVSDDAFSVGVMPETWRRTSLGDLAVGEAVNLERAVLAGGRLGGHIVQGHVDSVGVVDAVQSDGNALAIRIAAGPEILRYVVEKGFIAVEGASLTVTHVDEESFGIALIPFTRENTAPRLKEVGKRVNLEVDILAKYVEKLVIH